MEKTKVLTKLDFRTLKYCNLFLMKYQRKTKVWFAFTSLVALGIALYGFFVLDNYIFTIFGLFFIFYSIYTINGVEKKLDAQLARFFNGRGVITQTVEVDDEQIIVTRSVEPANPTVYDWSFITEISEMPQFYMLMVGKGSPIIIDRSDEALLEGTKENLDNIIHEKASMKPYKSTQQDIVKIPITYVHQEIPTEEAVNVESVVEDVQNEEDEKVEIVEEDSYSKETTNEDEFH